MRSARALAGTIEVGFPHHVAHLDLDADRDRRVRPDRDGHRDREARLTGEVAATTIRAGIFSPTTPSGRGAPPSGRGAAAPLSRRETTTILLLTALALALRVTSLSRSLFTDEAYSLALAQRSFPHMVGLFGYEANGTPYPIVLWPLIRIFGTGEALLRAPAVLAGTASVPALWWAARRFASPAGALLAAALLAINPMAIWYSQMARPYAFVVLASCLAFGALPRALDAGRGRRAWAAYVAAMTVLAYCDLLAVPIALPAQALIARRSGSNGFRRWLWSLLALLVCCVPLLVAVAIARSRRDALYWLPKPDRALVSLTLQEFAGGFSGVTAVRWATLAAGAALLGAAIWSIRGRRDAERRETFAIALAWGVLPVVLLLGVSFVHPLFWPRYAILALPGLCLLAALAAGRLRRSARGLPLAAGCVAIIVGVALVADVRQRNVVQENWLAPTAWLRSERSAGQPTVLDNVLMLPPLGYYDPAFRTRDGDLIVQEWHDRPLPSGVVGFKDPHGYGTVPNGPPSAALLASLARRGGGTVWMVLAQSDKALQGDPRDGAAVAWALSHCRVQVRESVGVWVLRASACAG
jgi:mannosyltransferase